MNRAKLWLGCRRHAAERHCVPIKQFVVRRKVRKKVFLRILKSNLTHLTQVTSKDKNGQEMSLRPLDRTSLLLRALNIREWAEKCFEERVFPREDYGELAELLTYVLHRNRRKGANKDKPPKNVDFKMEPGAFHHARFMAKAIYYIKMFLLLPELMSREFITDLEKRQIERMATFITDLEKRQSNEWLHSILYSDCIVVQQYSDCIVVQQYSDCIVVQQYSDCIVVQNTESNCIVVQQYSD